MENRPTIYELPPDIICTVGLLSNMTDFMSLGSTCKHIRQILDDIYADLHRIYLFSNSHANRLSFTFNDKYSDYLSPIILSSVQYKFNQRPEELLIALASCPLTHRHYDLVVKHFIRIATCCNSINVSSDLFKKIIWNDNLTLFEFLFERYLAEYSDSYQQPRTMDNIDKRQGQCTLIFLAWSKAAVKCLRYMSTKFAFNNIRLPLYSCSNGCWTLAKGNEQDLIMEQMIDLSDKSGLFEQNMHAIEDRGFITGLIKRGFILSLKKTIGIWERQLKNV